MPTTTFPQSTSGGSGDMILASVQSVTGAKTFDSSALKMKESGGGSDVITIAAPSIAANTTVTLPSTTGTFALTSDIPTGAQYLTLSTDGTLTAERVATAGNNITITDAGAGSTATFEWKHNPLKLARLWTDGVSAGDFSTVSSGTGAGVTANSANSNATHPGTMSSSTGTTTTGRACSCYIEATAIQFGTYAWRSVGCFQIPTLSDGTDTFSVMIGFNDTFTGPSPVDAIAIRYQHSVNSGKFEAVTSSNSSRTATDTGVTAAAGTWYSYEINVNAAGSSVEFKINGSVVATNTTNIPTGSSRVAGHGHNIVKSAGTTARTLITDCCLVEGQITR